MANNWGIHLSNDDMVDDWAIVKGLGVDNYTILHYQCAKYLPFMKGIQGIVLVRYYDKDYLFKNPQSYAQGVVEEALKWKEYTNHWTFCNELNLPEESIIGWDSPEMCADWQKDVALKLRELAPWMVIHSGAYSPTRDYVAYYRWLGKYKEYFDYIDVHCYGELGGMKGVVANVEHYFPGSKLFVSEFNGSGSLDFLKGTRYPATYFITKWKNPPKEWAGDLLDSPLLEEIRQTRKENPMLTKIGNLDVIDLRGDLPDEPGKMPPVDFTEKDFISIHHTVTSSITSPKTIWSYHKSLGWGGIGYNFLVDSKGQIMYVGECNTERAAIGANPQANKRGIHIAMIWDTSKEDPPQEMLDAVKTLIANIQHAYGWFIPVVPHRLFNANTQYDTSCPVGWRNWWKKILRAVGE